MSRNFNKLREEARCLFLAGEMSSNASMAARLGVKPHTVGRWRRLEDWDGLRRKIDRRAAELFVEKIATDRVTLNVRHFRYWDGLLAQLAEDLKKTQGMGIRELERIASILERAQKGQRLAKGLSTNGETEEAIRAEAQAETRKVIDACIDAITENVSDEETSDKIRRSILAALPAEEDGRAGESGDTSAH